MSAKYANLLNDETLSSTFDKVSYHKYIVITSSA